MALADLEYYKRAFSNLRPFRFARSHASVGTGVGHKAILLLAVIDQVAAGRFANGLITPDQFLVEAFQERWARLAGLKARTPDFVLPFYHLRSEAFWRLVPTDGMGFVLATWRQPTSLPQLRHFVACARLDADLIALLWQPRPRASLQEVLMAKALELGVGRLRPQSVARRPAKPSASDSLRGATTSAGSSVRASDIPLTPTPGTPLSVMPVTCRTLLDHLDADWRSWPISGEAGKLAAPADLASQIGIATLGDLEELTPLTMLALSGDEIPPSRTQDGFWSHVLAGTRAKIAEILAPTIERFLESGGERHWPSPGAPALTSKKCHPGALLVPDDVVLANSDVRQVPLLSSWVIAAVKADDPTIVDAPFADLVRGSARRDKGTVGGAPERAEGSDVGLRISDVLIATPAQLLSHSGFNENSYRLVTRLLRDHLTAALWRCLVWLLVEPDSSLSEEDPEEAKLLSALNAASIESLCRELIWRVVDERVGVTSNQVTHERRGLTVMLTRFGVPSGKPMSYREAGTRVGVGPERAHQLEEMVRKRMRDEDIAPYADALGGLVYAALRLSGGVASITAIAEGLKLWMSFGGVDADATIWWIVSLNRDHIDDEAGSLIAEPYTASQVRRARQMAVELVSQQPRGIAETTLIEHVRLAAGDPLRGVPDSFIQAVLACSEGIRREGDRWRADCEPQTGAVMTISDETTSDIVSWLEDQIDRAGRPLHWDELVVLAHARHIEPPRLGEAVEVAEPIQTLEGGYYARVDPPTKLDAERTTPAPSLTEEQRLVADALPTARILVTAGPGTGKTHTLIARLASLISRYDLSPGQDLLVLSFSRAAVREIRRRVGMSGSDVRFVMTYTFDSFATRLLMETDPGGAWMEEDYEGRIRAATTRIRTDPAVREIVSQFSHVVVDEIQDLVAEREDFVKAILEVCSGGFTLLGDPAQGIYNWRLSGEARRIGSAALYDWLRSRFVGELQEVILTRNHRAISKIAQAALPLGPKLARDQDDYSRILSDLREALGTVPAFETVEAAANILRGTRVRTAILCRTNGQALLLSRKLFKLGVHHRLQTSGSDRLVSTWLAEALEGVEWTRMGKTAFIREFEHRLGPAARDGVPDAVNAWRILKMMDRQPGDTLDLESVRERVHAGYVPDDAFQTPSAFVTISSVHRAKGLEFDRVIVVADELRERFEDDITSAEEARVLFVALTRAKRELYRLNQIGHKGLRHVETSERWIRRFDWRVADVEVRGEDIHAADPVGGFVLSSVDSSEAQRYIRDVVRPGDPVTLTRVATSVAGAPRVFYSVLHNGEVVGVTSEQFMSRLFGILKISHTWHVRWPALIEDLRVEAVDTVAGTSGASRRCHLGAAGLWLRVRVGGLGRLVF